MKQTATSPYSRLGAGLACALPIVLCLVAAAQPPPGRGGGPGRQQFKNLKVLKDTPDQVMPLMREYCASLGVRCDHCHDAERGGDRHSGFEKDTKPAKDVARKMILMVRDLNVHQKPLKAKATCFMCHHGRSEPDTAAPVSPGPGRRGQ